MLYFCELYSYQYLYYFNELTHYRILPERTVGKLFLTNPYSTFQELLLFRLLCTGWFSFLLHASANSRICRNRVIDCSCSLSSVKEIRWTIGAERYASRGKKYFSKHESTHTFGNVRWWKMQLFISKKRRESSL